LKEKRFGKIMNDVDQIYKDFWKDIVENEDGSINLEQLKKELYDFHFVIEEVPKVYMAVTNGAMSKPNYYANEVISIFNDYINEEFILKDDLRDILKALKDENYDNLDELTEDLEELLK
jgi:hypothetical protein